MNQEVTLTRLGNSTVLFVHGVGMAPMLFDRLVEAAGPLRCSAPLRLGYRDDAAPADFAAMVRDVRSMADAVAPAIVVGVSGGATLALAMALDEESEGSSSIDHVIAHEPLIGPLAPDLHAAVAARAAELAASPGPVGASRFVEALVGADVWAGLPLVARSFPASHAPAVSVEAERFVAFAPSRSALGRLHLPLTVTVGEASPSARHEAVHLIASLSGARVEVVPGAGHLACWEAPEAYARIITRSTAHLAGRS